MNNTHSLPYINNIFQCSGRKYLDPFSIIPFDSAMRKNNRQHILDIARKLFLEYGYNGISIRNIAKKAKLTTGAIYFHFKNKKEIYSTICIEAINTLHRLFSDGIKLRKTPAQKLISTYDSYLKFYYEFHDYYNVLTEYRAEYDDEPDPYKDEIQKQNLSIQKLMADIFKDGVNQGDFKDLDPKMVAFFLSAVAEGMLQFKKLGVMDAAGITDNKFREFMKIIVGQGIQKE